MYIQVSIYYIRQRKMEGGWWREEGESIVTEGWLETFDYRYKSG